MSQEFTNPKPWPKIRTVFFGNSGARSGQQGFKEAHALLKHNQIPLEQAQCFTNAEEFTQHLKAAIRDEVDLAIIGGGDGTLNLAAQQLTNSKTTLAVIPLGTGNEFALDIGIESGIPQAVEAILQTRIALLDTASVNDQYFLNVATAGITTNIAQSLEFKKELGKLAYLPAAIKSLKESKPFTVQIQHDHGIMTEQAVQLVACNGRFHGGPFIASPSASLTNGKLEVYVIKESSFWEIAQVGAFALTGDHIDLDQVEFIKTSQMAVNLTPNQPIIIDGEICTSQTYQFKIHPHSIKVLVPTAFQAPPDRFTDF